MSNSIVRLLLGGNDEPEPPNEVTALQREVRLAAMRADGALRLAAHLMDGVVDLDDHRRQLARDDRALHEVLIDIEAEGVSAAKRQQRNLYGKWELP